MAKFVFKLEALLEQRKREEQQCQRVLALEAAAVNAAQDAVRQINEEVAAGQDSVRQHLMGTLDMSFLVAHRRFMLAMQRQVTELLAKVVIAKKKMEEAREKLAEAAKRRKAIEKLREKKFERWRAEEAKKEAALGDEIGSQLGYHNLLQDQLADELEEAVE